MDKMAYDAMLQWEDHKEKYPEMYDKEGKFIRLIRENKEGDNAQENKKQSSDSRDASKKQG